MQVLLKNLNKLHTTELGIIRIKRNLDLDEQTDAVEYCKERINAPNTIIEKIGKNFYATSCTEVITVNASKLSIITAHRVEVKERKTKYE